LGIPCLHVRMQHVDGAVQIMCSMHPKLLKEVERIEGSGKKETDTSLHFVFLGFVGEG
jgi:hypothetical protein